MRISPEGCAGILWKSHEYAEKAAGALRFTSKDLLEFGIVDTVIQEPLGGAHRDPHQMAARLKIYLVKTLRELLALDGPTLLEQRYGNHRSREQDQDVEGDGPGGGGFLESRVASW